MTGTLSDQEGDLQVQRIATPANPESVAYSSYAPRTNATLQLAGALSELNPELQQSAVRYSSVQEQRANEQAMKDALLTGGSTLADAVRSGKLEPTQNPWYIMAYQRNAAAVKTKQAIADLNTQAAQWSEQNDPKAYATKYQHALSEIGKGYTDPDSQQGFNSVAQPAFEQALAQNQAYNVERIKTERKEDLSSLAGAAVMKAVGARGGRTDPGKVTSAIEEYHKEWLATGGTDADWYQTVVPGAIMDAAYNSKDATIIDLAKKMTNGAGGNIYDQVGQARNFEQTRYRIWGEQRDERRLGIQETEEKVFMDTYKAEGDLFNQFGAGIYSGQFDTEAAIKGLAGKYSPAVIGKTLQSIAQSANSQRELAADRTGAYASSPAGAQMLQSLTAEAQLQGWSPQFEQDLGRMVLNDQVSLQTAQTLRSTAQARTRAIAVANRTVGGNILQKEANTIRLWSQARDTAAKASDAAETAYRAAGGAYLSPEDHQDLQRSIIDAVDNFLQTQPKAYRQVGLVASQAARQWVLTHSAANAGPVEQTRGVIK